MPSGINAKHLMEHLSLITIQITIHHFYLTCSIFYSWDGYTNSSVIYIVSELYFGMFPPFSSLTGLTYLRNGSMGNRKKLHKERERERE